jgi:hypothetical protein
LWVAALVFLHVAPTGYSPLRNAVSEYGVGRFAWGYRAQVLLAAAAAVSLGVELHGRERRLLLVFAAARAAIAAYPTDLLGSGTVTRSGRIHLLLAAVAFASICWAASSDRWEPALGYVATAGAVGTVLAIRRVPQLRPVLGLLERVFYVAIIAWFFVVESRI